MDGEILKNIIPWIYQGRTRRRGAILVEDDNESISSDELESVWQTLISYGLPATNEIRVYEISGKFAGRFLAVFAIDSDGLRHLLVPLPIGETAKEDKKGAGIRVTHHTMIDHGVRANFVDIACRNSQLHNAFLYLACEVLQELSTISAGVAEACTEAINHWRALLERERASIFPEKKQLD